MPTYASAALLPSQERYPPEIRNRIRDEVYRKAVDGALKETQPGKHYVLTWTHDLVHRYERGEDEYCVRVELSETQYRDVTFYRFQGEPFHIMNHVELASSAWGEIKKRFRKLIRRK